MRALIFDGELHVDDVQLPVVGAGEALIRVRRAGICGTDLEITRGYKGFRGIPGHEFVGDVIETADTSWLGKRVCGEINISCHACPECRSGLRTHCRHRRVLGILNHAGAFAAYLTLPTVNLHEVPDEISDDSAVFVEPVAAAFRILEQVDVRASDRVLVLGDGRLGLLCAQVISLTGAAITLLGRHARKLSLVEGHGVALTTDPHAADDTFDIAVDATGTASGLTLAMQSLRPRGTLVLKSTTATAEPLDMSPAVVKEVTVLGSRCGPFPPAIGALRRGSVTVSNLISARYSLDQGIAAFHEAAQPGTLKVLLDPTETTSQTS